MLCAFIGVASMRQDEANASSWFSKAFFSHLKKFCLVENNVKLMLLPRLGFPKKNEYKDLKTVDSTNTWTVDSTNTRKHEKEKG